jgi:hypothetical protein
VFPVTVTATDNGSPSLTATNTFAITVNPATLSIAADARTKIYGAIDPALTFTVGGLQFSDTPASVLTGALVRATGETVTGSPYAITQGTLAANGNYTISFTGNSLAITKASLSVTADAKTKIYGAADPAFTVTYSGFVNSETPAVLGGTLAFTRAPGTNVGSYLITPSGLASGNYAITFNTGLLSITQAGLSITADAKTKTYGAVDPAFTASYAGFVNGETPAALGGTLTFTRAPGTNVGGYLITPSGQTSGNYNITFNTGTLTITKAALSVTADAKTKFYGATDPAFTVAYSGFVSGETSAVLGGTLTFTRAPGENVGSYLITPSGLTSGNYTISFNTGSLSITMAALSVTADAKTKIYGATDPAFSVTYSGFVNSETPAVLAGTLAFTRAPGENVGSYLITPSGLTSGNYTISFNTGSLSITKAALSVAADAKTKIYGAADPAFTVTYSGFVLGETPALLGGTLGFTRAPGENVGSYLITPSGLTSGNYTITFNTGSLSITKAALSVTAAAKTKIYGAADPALTFTVAGLQFSETSATALTGALTRTAGETVAGSPYAITQGTLTPNGNYTISFTGSTLAITRAALSITADAKTKIYGAADPAFTVTYAGFVNSETPAVLGGTLTFTRAPGENVGSYLITPGGLTSGNYTITFNAGSLAITKAALSVTANSITKTYGTVDPALTFTVSGLQFSDTAATALTGVLTRVGGETVAGGPYPITQGTLTPNGNYTVSFTGNTFSIIKAALSVTADAKTKVYGGVEPAFTVTYSGFVLGETPAVLGGTLAFTRAPGENVGSYLITPSGLTSGNYAITFNNGNLSITKAALSVTADGKAKVYGAADPTLTFTVSGLQFSDTSATVLTGALTRTAGDTVAGGPYAITQGTLTPNGNYTISFTGSSLTITKAALTVTGDAKTKVYGAADPAFTVTYVGFVNTETPAVLGGTLAFTRAPGENIGSYLITPSGLTSGNYNITFNPGTLTITAPAPLMLPLTLAGTNVVISWNAISNGVYRIQYHSALNATNWTDLAGDITATNSIASKTDLRTATNRFYRAQVLP